MKVIKRNGASVSYQRAKLHNAILGALTEVDPSALHVNDTLALNLSIVVEGQMANGMNVEEVQDLVEQAMMHVCPTAAKAFILYREDRAKLRAARKRPDPNMVSDYIHPAKYARYNPTLKRREMYEETVSRVCDMHLQKYSKLNDQQKAAVLDAFDMVAERLVLPSMRSMQFAGPAIMQNNARIYNCSFTHVDRIRVFGDIFYLLLCGCGVGYSVQRWHVEQLPVVQLMDPTVVKHFHIADCIEGWADAVTMLVTSAYLGMWVEFDYSAIRSEGMPLKTSGGKAPGHIPLRIALEKIRSLLQLAEGRKLRPIECHDIACFVAEAVLAGGIRRSSLISLFSHDDGEMATCKQSQNFEFNGKNSQRAIANNSAVFHRHEALEEDFYEVMELNRRGYGEPGFFFTDNYDYGCNPCGEIGLYPKDDNGNSGFAFCNLTEVNGAVCKSFQDLLHAVDAAALIGTLQAGYTSFPYLGAATENIAKRDALLGVSITGIMDNPRICLNESNLTIAVQEAKGVNSAWADILGIKPAMRVTTVKPSGTASLALGCVGSGIHPHHARRYFRRIIANRLEPVALYFREKNPHMVDEMPNGDLSLTFPVEAPSCAITAGDVTAIEFFLHVKKMFLCWVNPGNRLQSVPASPVPSHNVSATVVFKPSEWADLISKVWRERYNIASMTFLPASSDKNIPFMPREEVVTATDEARWNELISKYKQVDYTLMVEAEDTTDVMQEPACCGGSCDV